MPVSMVFWILFLIVLIITFFIMLPIARRGISTIELPAIPPPSAPEEIAKPEKPPAVKPAPPTPVEKPAEKPPTTPAKDPASERTPPEKPVEQPPVQTAPKPPAPQQPASQPSTPAASPPATQPAETRDRSIYFMQESDGAELRLVKVNRKLAVSNSPLIDCLNALLAGPTAEERRRGLISCVPPNTRLISARVNNNTVILNFNEEFRYITLGREGAAAQLQQIVWTATEFPNVQNVQIQIEGSTVDFLTEGVMIRNPIGR
jgi:spore germination protein GerM